MFIIINTTRQSTCKLLNDYSRGRRRPYIKEKGWIIRKLGPCTHIFVYNEEMLDICKKLKEKHPNEISIFVSYLLHVKELEWICHDNKKINFDIR